ncbi:hypothetical protein [Kibdelosporangium philippinense]|uniref:hypothetical protein n=1 Tax=Kibdelosporangium philippinense TaxID=211113 RepID=UPI0036220994
MTASNVPHTVAVSWSGNTFVSGGYANAAIAIPAGPPTTIGCPSCSTSNGPSNRTYDPDAATTCASPRTGV